MPRINFSGQTFDVPEQVSGSDLRRILGLSQSELPVRVEGDGSYQPINEDDEYHIADETKLDRVNKLVNG